MVKPTKENPFGQSPEQLLANRQADQRLDQRNNLRAKYRGFINDLFNGTYSGTFGTLPFMDEEFERLFREKIRACRADKEVADAFRTMSDMFKQGAR